MDNAISTEMWKRVLDEHRSMILGEIAELAEATAQQYGGLFCDIFMRFSEELRTRIKDQSHGG